MKNNSERLARNIVANLAYRYRFARKLANIERAKEYSVKLRAMQESHELEAWNAYISSKRILLGLD